jgi:hypothetical protein
MVLVGLFFKNYFEPEELEVKTKSALQLGAYAFFSQQHELAPTQNFQFYPPFPVGCGLMFEIVVRGDMHMLQITAEFSNNFNNLLSSDAVVKLITT